LLGRGTKDTGTLVVTGEYRHDIGPTSPADLRGEMGTLIAPSNAFNDRGAVVRDFFWMQRFFDARLRMLIGRGDPSDYVGAHRLQNVNNSFVNRHFSANPAVAFPGHGPLVGLSIQPNGEYYVTGGVSNAYSRTDSNETSSFFDEGDHFTFLEAGITPTIEGLGASRLAAGLWHIDERERDGLPSDEGVTVMFDQELSSTAQVFARYAYSDAELTNVRQIIQGGFGFHQLFGGSSDTLSGIALSLGIPRLEASENETALELFHRFQLTQNIQLAFGGQSIFDPGNNPDDSVVGVLYSRVRLAF
jgi:carbohydrate-selective porin OprB